MPVDVEQALTGLERRTPVEIVEDHLPSLELLEEFRHPSSVDVEMRAIANAKRPGSVFISTFYNGKHIIVPEGHPLTRLSSVVSPVNKDYPTGCFEGLSLYGDALTLFNARMQRLDRSLRTRRYRDVVDLESFAQMIVLIAEINADSATRDAEGNIVRAYGRPTIGFSEGGIGIGIHLDNPMYQAVGFNRMRRYLETSEPLRVVASDAWKRREQLNGKHSDSYGRASIHHAIAHDDLGADEAIYLGGVTENRTSRFREGEIVDGVGEEVVFRVGKTFIVPPPDNGRLGGTSLAHFHTYTAEELGYDVQFDVVTIDDVARGEVEAMYLCGNAIEFTGVQEIWSYEGTPSKDKSPKVITLPNVRTVGGVRQVSEEDKEIMGYYQDQLWGRKASTNPLLLTRIDRDRGRKMEHELKTKWYPGWFTN